MTNEEIKEIQREIRETQARLTVLQKVADNLKTDPEPWKRWRAEKGGSYWFVDNYGGIVEDIEQWDGEHGHLRHRLGNYFRTQALAERHAKRLRSMVPTCAMPKDGEEYWAVDILKDAPSARTLAWRCDCVDLDCYCSGRCFTSKESAEAWIAEFGDVWTTRVEGEGE